MTKQSPPRRSSIFHACGLRGVTRFDERSLRQVPQPYRFSFQIVDRQFAGVAVFGRRPSERTQPQKISTAFASGFRAMIGLSPHVAHLASCGGGVWPQNVIGKTALRLHPTIKIATDQATGRQSKGAKVALFRSRIRIFPTP
jgi:hypothetical protein